MYFNEIVTHPLGAKKVDNYPCCIRKKEKPLPDGAIVAEAFTKKYVKQGLEDNPSPNCPWHILNDEESCPLFES
jgi:hypothetical protein